MNEKTRAVHPPEKRHRGRRRAGWLFLLVVVVAGLGVFLWLRSSDVFAVKRITMTAVQHVSPEVVADITASAWGVSLLRLDTDGMERQLLALPYVRSAALHRRFPNTLEVELHEYEPVACIQAADGSQWLVAQGGRILEKGTSDAAPLLVSKVRFAGKLGATLPQILVRALEIVPVLGDQEVRESLPEVTKVIIATSGELTLELAGGIEVRLGDPTELNYKLKVSALIIQQYLRDGKEIRYVDARVPDHVAVNSN